MSDPHNLPWSEKYRAFKFSEIKGQELAIDKVKNFLRSFPAKKAVVLHGPPGIGKTSLAYAFAAENDAEILEMNASDLRNKEKIAQVIGPASQQRSLFKKFKLILIDEVDGISTRDRGGLTELMGLIEKSSFPLIITGNDIWQQKFNLLRQKSELVALKEIDYKTVLDILKEVCIKENLSVMNDVLTSIAIKARGDMRAALNDLQSLSQLDEKTFVKEVGDRNKEVSIFNALQFVFKNAQIDSKMLQVYDEVHMETDEIFLWIEENIPYEYRGRELFRAFDALSRADVFRGRIYRQQHWRFLIYENFFLGAGIAAAKKYNRTGWTNYKKPSRILKIWLNNQRMAKKKSICEKYARLNHVSIKKAMKDFLILRQILVDTKVRKELKLDEEEIEFLDKPLIV
ncbi:replication factor C large subunit [Candidatus Pacearchaeota archaeon]|nr:replication factor C large subunit [Candidatus Pacearchaeota archaeon]